MRFQTKNTVLAIKKTHLKKWVIDLGRIQRNAMQVKNTFLFNKSYSINCPLYKRL